MAASETSRLVYEKVCGVCPTMYSRVELALVASELLGATCTGPRSTTLQNYDFSTASCKSGVCCRNGGKTQARSSKLPALRELGHHGVPQDALREGSYCPTPHLQQIPLGYDHSTRLPSTWSTSPNMLCHDAANAIALGTGGARSLEGDWGARLGMYVQGKLYLPDCSMLTRDTLRASEAHLVC
ncbi:hypothetical protein J1614_009995 [Plenodomus biglobosus]|nr:hypothetical protein J1614_009995 [Plenodomus biglobosus]